MIQRRSNSASELWQHADIGEDCWEWQGHHNVAGYGVFSVNGRAYMAHRLAWELAKGPIPDGMYVCHHCDNPPCIRPSHLFVGTHSDNMQDMVRKGRRNPATTLPSTQGDLHYSRRHPEKVLRGALNGMAKLSPDQVREMRALHDAGVTQRELSRRFGVSNQGVSRVVRRKVYKDVA